MKNYWHVFYRSYGGLFSMSVEAPTHEAARKEFHRIKGEATKDFYIWEIENHLPSYDSMFATVKQRAREAREQAW